MGDVARALILPDRFGPSNRLLLNLALYWDEVVILRHRFPDEPGQGLYFDGPPLGEQSQSLVENGLVRVESRELSVQTLLPAMGKVDKGAKTAPFLSIERDAEGRAKFGARYMLAVNDDGVPINSEGAPVEAMGTDVSEPECLYRFAGREVCDAHGGCSRALQAEQLRSRCFVGGGSHSLPRLCRR